MRKIKMMALAMGLALTAITAMMQPSPGAADLTCEARCREEYEACEIFCSKNPCLISCDYGLRVCLDRCGSEI